MSSLGSPTLDLDVRSRRTESVAVRVTLGVAIIAPALLQADLLTRVILTVIGCTVVACGFWLAGWWGARRVEQILWLTDGRWRLTRRGGLSIEARLLGNSRLASGCVWLHWQCEQKTGLAPGSLNRSLSRHAMLLARRDVSAAEWRRLRVRLKLDSAAGQRSDMLMDENEAVGKTKFREYLTLCHIWVSRRWLSPQPASAMNGTDQDCQAVRAPTRRASREQ